MKPLLFVALVSAVSGYCIDETEPVGVYNSRGIRGTSSYYGQLDLRPVHSQHQVHISRAKQHLGDKYYLNKLADLLESGNGVVKRQLCNQEWCNIQCSYFVMDGFCNDDEECVCVKTLRA